VPQSWARLGSVKVENMAADRDTARANIVHAMTLGLPEIDQLPEWEKYKCGEPIAIVAAGPSLRYTLSELGAFRTIMVAGSAHDFVISRGIKPSYAVIVDPTPDVVVSYLQRRSPTCNYLVSSMCDQGVFEHLKAYPVTMWHTGGELNGEDILKGVVPPDKTTLCGGGCTVGLRCIDVANRFGYYEQHLFGFDSCLDPNSGQTHAFPLNDPSKEFVLGTGSHVIDLKIGMDKERARSFRVPNYLAVQAWEFEKLLKTSEGAVKFTVHGDGVFAEMLRLYNDAKGEQQVRKVS